jgi:hypothetical protein
MARDGSTAETMQAVVAQVFGHAERDRDLSLSALVVIALPARTIPRVPARRHRGRKTRATAVSPDSVSTS